LQAGKYRTAICLPFLRSCPQDGWAAMVRTGDGYVKVEKDGRFSTDSAAGLAVDACWIDPLD